MVSCLRTDHIKLVCPSDGVNVEIDKPHGANVMILEARYIDQLPFYSHGMPIASKIVKETMLSEDPGLIIALLSTTPFTFAVT